MKKDKHNFLFLTAAIFSVGIVAIGIFFLVRKFIPELEKMAQFGDSFGFVNVIFSGLALFAISYSLLMQIRAFSLQQEELKLTREELKKTAVAQVNTQKALEKQVKIMAYQSMITAYSDVYSNKIAGLNSYVQNEIKGRVGIASKYQIEHKLYKEKIKPLVNDMELELEKLKNNH